MDQNTKKQMNFVKHVSPANYSLQDEILKNFGGWISHL